MTVVLAGAGVPGAKRLRRRGDRRASTAAEASGALVFHGGTAVRDGALVTNGGRILSVTGTGGTVASRTGACVRCRRDDLASKARVHRTDIAAAVDG